jgi:hypothetical protein
MNKLGIICILFLLYLLGVLVGVLWQMGEAKECQKHNMEIVEDCEERLAQCQPMTYSWRLDNGNRTNPI